MVAVLASDLVLQKEEVNQVVEINENFSEHQFTMRMYLVICGHKKGSNLCITSAEHCKKT